MHVVSIYKEFKLVKLRFLFLWIYSKFWTKDDSIICILGLQNGADMPLFVLNTQLLILEIAPADSGLMLRIAYCRQLKC